MLLCQSYMNSVENLTVRAVAKLSGVSAHTLRAWERRYQVIVPSRTSTGHRSYSYKDVEKVRLLNELIEMGHSIGKLSRMTHDELNRLKLKTTQHQNGELIHAIEKFDLELLDQKIRQARLALTMSDFVHLVAAPLLSEVGRRVSLGLLDITQEHLLSAILRNHLGSILSQAQQSFLTLLPEQKKNKRFIFTTREGDHHEFGILLGAILCASQGNFVQYIGPNTPVNNLAKMAIETKTDIIAIGASPLPSSFEIISFEKYTEKLLEQLPETTSIWLGGFCDFNLKKKIFARRVRYFESLRALENEL